MRSIGDILSSIASSVFTPKGLHHIAQGCHTRLPWVIDRMPCLLRRGLHRFNPFRGRSNIVRLPRVAAGAATLGYVMQPLRGKDEHRTDPDRTRNSPASLPDLVLLHREHAEAL